MARLDAVDDRRALFDNISLNVISKLENFETISTIEFRTEDGTTANQISDWEKRNAPLSLPEDLISFYSMFNGVNLCWDVMIGLKSVTVGEMRLNELNQMTKISSRHFAAFILSSQASVGDIALVYISDSNRDLDSFSARTEIWFHDVSSNWHYVCQSFTHLLRLMVTHLGLQLIQTHRHLPHLRDNYCVQQSSR